MCGISGIYSLSNKPIKNLKSRLELMTDLLHHRGPDQKGIFTSQNDTFGLSMNEELDTRTKALIFATAISIDFDYFEDNQGGNSPLQIFD